MGISIGTCLFVNLGLVVFVVKKRDIIIKKKNLYIWHHWIFKIRVLNFLNYGIGRGMIRDQKHVNKLEKNKSAVLCFLSHQYMRSRFDLLLILIIYAYLYHKLLAFFYLFI
jgi:hypothetical protein